ncbi:hypothetical protein [Photorhabdus stackebrandtii]|uniref:Uncharacterized protein n=1 Tax=Photorhabdus stackebrandtii TaxID=1123042 RepID=A0A7X5QM60_9GAMM|nr:hypothetical protein [Photorhabdus stackebrandtii]NHB96968.1 hypothetical protein [Photorhabdus stackebrandtii]
MTISFVNDPSGADSVIVSFLQGIIDGGSLSEADKNNKINTNDVSSSNPIKMYYVDRNEFEKTKSLTKAAHATGWRYLLLSGSSAVSDLHLNMHDANLIVSSMTLDGPIPVSTVEALLAAEMDSRVQQQSYEVRQLNLPWCHFVALWLHNPIHDIIIPLKPTLIRDIAIHKLYEVEEISNKIIAQIS